MLAVGPGGLDKDGKRVACSVAAGDKVLIPQVCGMRSLAYKSSSLGCWFSCDPAFGNQKL